jgi:hypothetical protein
VTRPAKVSNPYVLIEHGGEYTREESLRLYKQLVQRWKRDDPGRLHELKNYDYLACYCEQDQPCHADILIDWLRKNSG